MSLRTTILNLMKMEESSPNSYKNTVGKGEIACFYQFLLFPQCFQNICTADLLRPGLVWESVSPNIQMNRAFSKTVILKGGGGNGVSQAHLVCKCI